MVTDVEKEKLPALPASMNVLRQCFAVTAKGLRCGNDTAPGDVVCRLHFDARDQSTVVGATARLMAESQATLEKIIYFRDHATPEDSVKLQAAKLLFSRQIPETAVIEHRVRMDAALIWERLEALVEQRSRPDLPESHPGQLVYRDDGRVAIDVAVRDTDYESDVGTPLASLSPPTETERSTSWESPDGDDPPRPFPGGSSFFDSLREPKPPQGGWFRGRNGELKPWGAPTPRPDEDEDE